MRAASGVVAHRARTTEKASTHPFWGRRGVGDTGTAASPSDRIHL